MFNTRFWSDSWIVDDLNPLDRYLFMYLLLNEKASLCGIYELPIRTIANETGIEKDEIKRMIDRLKPKIYYEKGWVVLTNAIKHQNYKNPKIKVGIQNDICKVPVELAKLVNVPEDADITLSCPIDST